MRSTRWMLLLLTAVLLGGAGGCANNGTITGGDATLPENENSAAYLDRISTAPCVSENDAARAMLLLADQQDATATFSQRVGKLADRQVVDPSWDHVADRPITRGRVAYMVFQATEMPGGVIVTLTGPSQRYCLRELQYRRMMIQGPAHETVSGMELVAVLTRASIYRQTGQVPNLVGNTDEEGQE
ncbi:MAG: hypothetical protein ACLFV7_10710 [Phycisphaerae bacterium]